MVYWKDLQNTHSSILTVIISRTVSIVTRGVIVVIVSTITTVAIALVPIAVVTSVALIPTLVVTWTQGLGNREKYLSVPAVDTIPDGYFRD